MATLTIAIDPVVLEAARQEAERRHVTLDQLFTDYISGVARARPTVEETEALISLMNGGPLGHMDRPLTRDEIYEERSWPRS